MHICLSLSLSLFSTFLGNFLEFRLFLLLSRCNIPLTPETVFFFLSIWLTLSHTFRLTLCHFLFQLLSPNLLIPLSPGDYSSPPSLPCSSLPSPFYPLPLVAAPLPSVYPFLFVDLPPFLFLPSPSLVPLITCLGLQQHTSSRHAHTKPRMCMKVLVLSQQCSLVLKWNNHGNNGRRMDERW